MEQTLVFQPQNVCCKQMEIRHENGVILGVTFVHGCPGNTMGLSRLLVGRKIEEVIPLLDGIQCRGSRTGKTSCPDQLAKALKKIQENA